MKDYEVEVEWIGGPKDGAVFLMEENCHKVALAAPRVSMPDDPEDAPLYESIMVPVRRVEGSNRRVAVWAEREEST